MAKSPSVIAGKVFLSWLVVAAFVATTARYNNPVRKRACVWNMQPPAHGILASFEMQVAI
jgi:hypothetical protein